MWRIAPSGRGEGIRDIEKGMDGNQGLGEGAEGLWWGERLDARTPRVLFGSGFVSHKSV